MLLHFSLHRPLGTSSQWRNPADHKDLQGPAILAAGMKKWRASGPGSSSREAVGSSFHTLWFKNPTESTLKTPWVKETRELVLHSYLNTVSHKKGVLQHTWCSQFLHSCSTILPDSFLVCSVPSFLIKITGTSRFKTNAATWVIK